MKKQYVRSAVVCVLIAGVLILLALVRTGLIVKSDKGGAEPKAVSAEEKTRFISVDTLCQHPELPTGCESVAAVMVLRFYEEDVSAGDFAENWLSKSSNFYTSDGQDFGPDPNYSFAGDPFTSYGYGCYAPVIADAVNSMSEKCKALVVKGKSLEYLCVEYTDKGIPLLVWATIDMTRSQSGPGWVLPDGSFFTWISGEHCLVLVGYDNTHYYFNDPNKGETVGYEKAIVNMRYRELGSQAVVITPK